MARREQTSMEVPLLYAALDIHKEVFQAAVLDVETGECWEERFAANREALTGWACRWQGQLSAVVLEATTGWRWVCRELQALRLDVRLADPAHARALRGRTRHAKTDKLDARWLALLLAKQMLPEAWIPPEDIQELRDKTRLRLLLADDRRRWAQRLHALLVHEGWPCQRGRLLTQQGRRWVAALNLPPSTKAHAEMLLRLIEAIETEQDKLELELGRFARHDDRCRLLMTIFGVGPILASHILAEIGDATRFRRARQLVRAAGLDPTVVESAGTRHRGKLAKQGAPQLRWALVEAAHHARSKRSPDRQLYLAGRQRGGTHRAILNIARKIAKRSYHLLRLAHHEAAAA